MYVIVAEDKVQLGQRAMPKTNKDRAQNIIWRKKHKQFIVVSYRLGIKLEKIDLELSALGDWDEDERGPLSRCF